MYIWLRVALCSSSNSCVFTFYSCVSLAMFLTARTVRCDESLMHRVYCLVRGYMLSSFHTRTYDVCASRYSPRSLPSVSKFDIHPIRSLEPDSASTLSYPFCTKVTVLALQEPIAYIFSDL